MANGGGVHFVPPPNIGGALAALGESLAKIIDPDAERRRQVENFLLQNPEVLGQFAAAQRTATREAGPPRTEVAREAADARRPAPSAEGEAERISPNVLEAFGFGREQAADLLRLAPETPAERLKVALTKAGFTELEAERLVAESKLKRVEAEEGADVARLEGETARALMKADVPRLTAQFEVINAERGIEAGEQETKRLRDYAAYLSTLPAEVRNQINLSRFDPAYFEALLARERMSLQAALASLQSAKDPLEVAEAQFDLIRSYDDQFADLIERHKESSPDEQRVIIDQLNRLEQQRMATFDEVGIPNIGLSFLAEEDKNFLRANGITFRRFHFPNLDEAHQQAVDKTTSILAEAIAEGASAEEELGRILAAENPGEITQLFQEAWRNMTADDKSVVLRDVKIRARAIREARGGEGRPAIEAAGRTTGRVGRFLFEDILLPPAQTIRAFANDPLLIGRLVEQGLSRFFRAAEVGYREDQDAER